MRPIPTATLPRAARAQPAGSWLSAAAALGSLIFSLHNMVSDPATLVAWSWTGYANGKPKGPLPHLHGSYTLMSQCLGLMLPLVLSDPTILLHPIWLLVGSISTYVLYAYRDWLGYSGGLVFAFWLTSITPVVIQRAGMVGNVGKTYFTTWLVTCLLNLASIFTVAYALFLVVLTSESGRT